MNSYDIIVVGAGAAGLTAALYASRRKLSTLVIGKEIGGQSATTLSIENYPGVDSITGPELMSRFAEQAKKFGAQIIADEITSVTKTAEGFSVQTINTTYQTKAIILAFGSQHRHLDVPGEKEFLNKGVVYCATCDAPFFEGKEVAIIGGGNGAMYSATVLIPIASKVYLIHRSDKFSAEPLLIEKVKQSPKVEIIMNATVKEIVGEKFVEGIIINTLEGEKKLSVEGVFVAIGHTVDSAFLNGLVELNPTGEIIADQFGRTSCAGIFAAGDVTTVPYKQMIIAAGEGAKAALSAYDYIETKL
jgi:thioredoxin-disulfide reductase